MWIKGNVVVEGVHVGRVIAMPLKCTVAENQISLAGDEVRRVGVGGHVLAVRGNDLDALQQNVVTVMTDDSHAGLTVNCHVP